MLAAAIYARYIAGLTGFWRPVYAIGIVATQYFLVFVAIVQAFLKVPALNALAPTGSELPFAVAQCAVLAIFIWLGFAAVQTFRRHVPLAIVA